MTPLLRRSAVAVAATAVVLSAGGASLAVASPHAPAATKHIKSGKTSIQLNSETVSNLFKDHFGVAPTGRAKVSSSFVLSFPVTGGTFANAGRGKIEHAGGIKVSKRKKHVTIKNLVLTLKTGIGTAAVTGHGRMTALRIGDPQAGSRNSFSGYSVKLAKPLIRVLDRKFHTKAFKRNPTLGTGSTKMHFK